MAAVDKHEFRLPSGDWSYPDAVDAWQRIDSAQAWAKAYIAYTVCERFGRGKLRQLAEDVRVSYETVKHYRTVWRAWEGVDVHTIRFGVAAALMALPDRCELVEANPGMTVKQARALVKARGQQPPPEVAEEVWVCMFDPEAGKTLRVTLEEFESVGGRWLTPEEFQREQDACWRRKLQRIEELSARYQQAVSELSRVVQAGEMRPETMAKILAPRAAA